MNIFLAIFDTELFTCTHWRVQMSYQLYRSPYLNYWTYFWTKSPRSWTFKSDLLTSFDFLSVIQKSIFYLLFFLSIMNFQFRLIDFFLLSFGHTEVHILHSFFFCRSWTFNSESLTPFDFISATQESIFYMLSFYSVPRVLDRELSTHTHCLTLVTSAIKYRIFDLRDIFLAKEYPILTFSYIAIDYFWFYFNHTEDHIRTLWTNFW